MRMTTKAMTTKTAMKTTTAKKREKCETHFFLFFFLMSVKTNIVIFGIFW